MIYKGSVGGIGGLNGLPSLPPWREKDGIISFLVRSDGTTGEGWLRRLLVRGFHVGEYAKDLLCSPEFVPTTGVTTRVAVLKGALFEDGNRLTGIVRASAAARGLLTPSVELACLIRKKFTDEDIEAMGLWCIVAMHEPINDSDGDPALLVSHRGGDGRLLSAYSQRLWNRGSGFAFTVATYRLV